LSFDKIPVMTRREFLLAIFALLIVPSFPKLSDALWLYWLRHTPEGRAYYKHCLEVGKRMGIV